MNYVQFSNLLGDENFAVKIKYIAPFDFIIIYKMIGLYKECVKGSDIILGDPKLTKEFADILSSIDKVAEKTCGHKQLVQFLHVKDVLGVLKGIIGQFVGDPTLIFRALVMQKYQSELAIGFEAVYGP